MKNKKSMKKRIASLLCLLFICSAAVPVQASSYSHAAQITDLLAEEDKNTLISPLSLDMALAMAGNGASGTTRKEMETYLGSSVSSFNKFAKTNYAKDLDELKVANSIWLTTKKGYDLNSSYSARLKSSYQAQCTRVNFSDAATVTKINRWVRQKTGGMIPKILGSTNKKSRLMLVNALYFDSEWRDKFSEYGTQKDTFTNSSGAVSSTDFMNGEAEYYFKNSKATGFAKTYKNSRFEFIAILPRKSGSFTLSELNLDSFLKTRSSSVDVHVKMPKFTFSYTAKDLKETLKQLGIKTAFTNFATFDKMLANTNKKLKIDRVVQKSKIIVDEAGTKAAAATVVDMVNVTSAAPQESVYVTLDRPFAFLIYDKEADAVLFAGKVNQL